MNVKQDISFLMIRQKDVYVVTNSRNNDFCIKNIFGILNVIILCFINFLGKDKKESMKEING